MVWKKKKKKDLFLSKMDSLTYTYPHTCFLRSLKKNKGGWTAQTTCSEQ